MKKNNNMVVSKNRKAVEAVLEMKVQDYDGKNGKEEKRSCDESDEDDNTYE
jgi:hypothetical protein